MTDHNQEVRDKIRRTIGVEFVRMEDDFDRTRTIRETIVDKIMTDVAKVQLLDENGKIKEDTDTGLRMYTTALRAISDMEKANAQAISLKLKQQEVEIANSAAAKERIAIVLKATAPGKIEEDFPSEKLEETLSEMFDSDIKPHELKTSPRDLNEE